MIAARGERPVLQSEDVGRIVCIELPVAFDGGAVVFDADDCAVAAGGEVGELRDPIGDGDEAGSVEICVDLARRK